MATPEEGEKGFMDGLQGFVLMGPSSVDFPTRPRRVVQEKSDQDIKQMSVKAIKDQLTKLQVDYNGCIERFEIEQLLRDARCRRVVQHENDHSDTPNGGCEQEQPRADQPESSQSDTPNGGCEQQQPRAGKHENPDDPAEGQSFTKHGRRYDRGETAYDKHFVESSDDEDDEDEPRQKRRPPGSAASSKRRRVVSSDDEDNTTTNGGH